MEDKLFIKKLKSFIISSCNMNDATTAMFTSNLDESNICMRLVHYFLYIWTKFMRKFDDNAEMKARCIGNLVTSLMQFGFNEQEANTFVMLLNRFNYDYVTDKIAYNRLTQVDDDYIESHIETMEEAERIQNPSTVEDALMYLRNKFQGMSEKNMERIRILLEHAKTIDVKSAHSAWLINEIKKHWYFAQDKNNLTFENDYCNVSLNNAIMQINCSLDLIQPWVTSFLRGYARAIDVQLEQINFNVKGS